MRVISDTSPVSNLAVIGRLRFLKRLHGFVCIPPAVENELSQLHHPGGCREIQEARQDGWLKIEYPVIPLPDFPNLHIGETEAIALALQTSESLLLIDESEGRDAARSLGLKMSGVIGVLIRAKNKGWIESLERELIALRSEAGFFISPKLMSSVLAAVGETID